MAKTVGRWVVYERKGTEFVHLSELFKTKDKAEKEREKLKEKYAKSSIGVGFVSLELK